eukprot:6182174-Pleurochrysis_carterae.AAC.5
MLFIIYSVSYTKPRSTHRANAQRLVAPRPWRCTVLVSPTDKVASVENIRDTGQKRDDTECQQSTNKLRIALSSITVAGCRLLAKLSLSVSMSPKFVTSTVSCCQDAIDISRGAAARCVLRGLISHSE